MTTEQHDICCDMDEDCTCGATKTIDDKRLNCVCVDFVREVFGQPPLYEDDEDDDLKPQQKMRLSTLARRIRDRDPAAVVELRSTRHGSVFQVFVNGHRVIRHNTKRRPMSDLLPKIEQRWGRVWE